MFLLAAAPCFWSWASQVPSFLLFSNIYQSNDLTGFFCFNPKISCWHSENILHLLRNLSYLAVLPKGWNENCCLCSCLLVVCMMGLNVIFLFTGRTKKRDKMETFAFAVNLQGRTHIRLWSGLCCSQKHSSTDGFSVISTVEHRQKGRFGTL